MNSKKKYSITTEWLAGIMGPDAFAGEAQKFVHHLIENEEPKGWSYQRPNSLLLNLKLRHESLLVAPTSFSEVILSGEANTGTMLNSVEVYSHLRLGKMNPYFQGTMNQLFSNNKNSFQAYINLSYGAIEVFHNTLLEGPIFNNKDNVEKIVSKPIPHHLVLSSNFTLVVSYKTVGLSYSFRTYSSMLKYLPGKDIGNLSLYIRV